MTEHYFTPQPRAGHRDAEFRATLRGIEFRFRTDRAVFSRERIDPGTRLLVEAMRIGRADTVLDLGCGYGVIGIVAARLAADGRVYLVDVNERAVELARANLELNGVHNAEVRAGDGTEPVAGIRFDTILMNPPVRAGKAAVRRLVAQAGAALRPPEAGDPGKPGSPGPSGGPGGSLWVVIGNRQGAPSWRRHLAEIFEEFEDVDRGGGYHVYRVARWRGERIDAGPPRL